MPQPRVVWQPVWPVPQPLTCSSSKWWHDFQDARVAPEPVLHSPLQHLTLFRFGLEVISEDTTKFERWLAVARHALIVTVDAHYCFEFM